MRAGRSGITIFRNHRRVGRPFGSAHARRQPVSASSPAAKPHFLPYLRCSPPLRGTLASRPHGRDRSEGTSCPIGARLAVRANRPYAVRILGERALGSLHRTGTPRGSVPTPLGPTERRNPGRPQGASYKRPCLSTFCPRPGRAAGVSLFGEYKGRRRAGEERRGRFAWTANRALTRQDADSGRPVSGSIARAVAASDRRP